MGDGTRWRLRWLVLRGGAGLLVAAIALHPSVGNRARAAGLVEPGSVEVVPADEGPRAASRIEVVPPSAAEPEPAVARRLTRGRRSLLAGIFLSYAGVGLTVSGAVLALDPGPGGTRPAFGQLELGLTFTAASALMATGGAVQIGGSTAQLAGMRELGIRSRPGLRGAALGASGLAVLGGLTGAVMTANPASRQGSALVVFGTGGLSLLAATLHIFATVDADHEVRQKASGIRIEASSTGMRLHGWF